MGRHVATARATAMFRNPSLPSGVPSVFDGVARRQWDARHRHEPHVDHPWLMRGLRLTAALEKHAGCVNALSWNDDTSLLLSGGDDLCVCVWSLGSTFPCRGSVYTGHAHNIFSAEFVPNTGSNQCVTIAGDGDVRRVDVSRGFASAGADRVRPRGHRLSESDLEASPHAVSLFDGDGDVDDAERRAAGMGMKLRFAPGSAHVFLTTHQDGRVRRFDLRLPNGNHETLCDLSVQGSCSDVAFDPTSPTLFAVGCDDPYVRVFDMRHYGNGAANRGASATRARASSPSEREHPSLLPVVAKYSPGRGAGFNTKRLQFDGVSGLAYSRTGELAVNYRGERLYVIDRRAAEREYRRAAAARGPAWSADDGLLDGWAMDAENAHRLAWTSRWPPSAVRGAGEGDPTRGGSAMDAPTALHPSRSPSPEFGYDIPSDEDEDADADDAADDDAAAADDAADDDSRRAGTASDRRSASVPRDRTVSRGRSATPAAWTSGNAGEDPWSLFDADPTLRADPSVRRFVGHKNVKTFLKGVAFMCDDAYVATGSDCGGLFVWRVRSGALVQKVQADSQVVNNVCPHPRLPVAATSGIDDVVRVWEPGEGTNLARVPTHEAEDEDELAEAMLTELERGGHFAEVWDRLARRRGDDTDDEDADDARLAAEFDGWTRRGRERDDEDDEDDDESSSSSDSSAALDGASSDGASSDGASGSDASERDLDAFDNPDGAGRASASAIGELARAETRAETARRGRREPSPRLDLDDGRGETSLPGSAAETAETREKRRDGVGADDTAVSGRAEEAAIGPSGVSGLRRSKRARASATGR